MIQRPRFFGTEYAIVGWHGSPVVWRTGDRCWLKAWRIDLLGISLGWYSQWTKRVFKLVFGLRGEWVLWESSIA